MAKSKKTNPSAAKLHKKRVSKADLDGQKRNVQVPKLKWYEVVRASHLPKKPLPGAVRLFWRSFAIYKRYWKPFAILALVYAVLNIVLVRGLGGGTNLSTIKDNLTQSVHSAPGQIASSLSLFAYLLGNSSNSSSSNGGVYQTLIVVVVSLAAIWSLRQAYQHNHFQVRDAFYKGIYPAIPFLLVLLVIALQLLPLLIGAGIYSIVISNGIAVGGFEHFLWLLLLLLLCSVSVYWLCSSLFALYIVSLPDIRPIQALRSAREIVRFRRLQVLRKILFLPLALAVIFLVILLPVIAWWTPAAEWFFFGLSILGLLVIHSYMYALYRELLN